jgi:hypothetical protein
MRESGVCIGNEGDKMHTLWFGTVTMELAHCHFEAI